MGVGRGKKGFQRVPEEQLWRCIDVFYHCKAPASCTLLLTEVKQVSQRHLPLLGGQRGQDIARGLKVHDLPLAASGSVGASRPGYWHFMNFPEKLRTVYAGNLQENRPLFCVS